MRSPDITRHRARPADGRRPVALTETDRRLIWVRAGGRCTLCNDYLMEGHLSSVEVPLGELAHNVGQKDSAKSARGLNPLPVEDRDSPDNILLACAACHNEIDKEKAAGVIDVPFLAAKKRAHESRIKHQTGLVDSDQTAVLRMAGDIRGDTMALPRGAASMAVLKQNRFPFFLDDYDRQGVEVDLRHLGGEHPLESDVYYPAARRKIDTAVAQVREGMLRGDIDHVSVFAIARVPLLVYLGSRLDDGVPVDVYQRSRSRESWLWADADPGTTFTLTQVAEGTSNTPDAVLITNLSGATPLTELPGDLVNAPVWSIDVSTGPDEDVFAHPDVLARFGADIRTFFTRLEQTHKHLDAIHLFGALPLSGAVTLGRILKSDGLRPALHTYDRTETGYVRALEI